jgi:hypothetical protein
MRFWPRTLAKRANIRASHTVSAHSESKARIDWVTRPGAGLFWWCLPLGRPVRGKLLATIDARYRTNLGDFVPLDGDRLHLERAPLLSAALLYLRAAFLVGAAALGLFAAGMLTFGPHSTNNIIGVTLAIALLSFVPEIWKKYA